MCGYNVQCMFVPDLKILCKVDFLIASHVYNLQDNFTNILGKINFFAWFQIH